jgi:glucose-induced degradation protein 8
LQQQQLIELIREDKIDEALNFAQDELAPRGEENVFFHFLIFKRKHF